MPHRTIIQLIIVILCIASHMARAVATCKPDEFTCKDDTTCISAVKLCNGVADCADNSDEMDCDFKMCRKPAWFQCALPHGPCLSADLICNGIENCPGGEDEFECADNENGFPFSSSPVLNIHTWQSAIHNCSIYEFTCKSDHSCVPLYVLCDGKSDCRDGSDETTGCISPKANCMGFLCKNKRCLESKTWVCDGIDDCGDGSDEVNCADVCIPEMGKFLCVNNITCLPLEKVCDDSIDCPDQSDESFHCKASNNCKNKTCPPAAKCHMMPQSGAECICPKGYSYSADKNICVDINECVAEYGICSQSCINVPGSFKCTCDEGYTLEEDSRTCKANGEEALLLYTTQVTVMGIKLKSKRVYTIAQNLTKVIGVSYDGEHIYWTNIKEEAESIVKANADGSKPEILLTAGIDAPEDLAVDWLTGNIYFSDNVMRHIAVCSGDGHFCTVLVTDNVRKPRGVALWPQRAQIFWTDWGKKPMIARASMDGKNSNSLVTENIHWPNGLALDMYNERIYWVDAKISTIESVRTDGLERRMVLNEILKHPYGLAIFEDHIYWSDWGTNSIHACNKFTGKDHKIITKDRTIYAVHIYHASKQKKISHACEKSDCSHLCLLAENNAYTCACPDGMQLSRDKLHCVRIQKKQLLFLGVRNNLLEMEHTTFGRHSITQTRKLNLFIHELAYNSVNTSVFVADNYRKIISEVDLLSYAVKSLVTRNVGNVTALAFDYLAYNLYWSDAVRHVVEVFSLQTRHRAIVAFFAGLEAPIGLAVIPEDGKMFVALKNRLHVHIDQISLNGLGEHTHVLEDELGDDFIKFVTDVSTKTLFWTDSDLGRISFFDYHNTRPYTFRSRLRSPYAVTIVGEDMFWSQLNSNRIYWAHKSNIGLLKRFDIEVNQDYYLALKFPVNIAMTASRTTQITEHSCRHRNGGCSHVCVSMGKQTSGCLCPAGWLFKDFTNRTCIEAIDCEFRCGSGECLTLSRKCNGHIDCVDASDENACDRTKSEKPKVVCEVGSFMCHNAEQCLPAHKHCDGKKQCSDGSDEEHCEHFDATKNCHRLQFACHNGNCIDLSIMCNGVNDCGDNSDEENCKSSSDLYPICGTDMFQCNSGTCISKSWECDGEIDCPDASDEHDKCSTIECPLEMHKCHLGQCIDKLMVCDGHNDCGDFSDELNCKQEKPVCGDKLHVMYQCPSNPAICLNISAKCNGTAECGQAEDEKDCDKMCNLNEFQCEASEKCIRLEFRCDKQKDCLDGSDEKNCEYPQSHEESCGPKMWDCRNGGCINEARVCDGIRDCTTGADEGPLCQTACNPVSGAGPCADKCKATPTGAVCSCSSGYKLAADHKTCLDINECEEFAPCAQTCQNTNGSYKCTCYPDFMLHSDKTACKSFEKAKSILFSSYDEVRSLTDYPVMLTKILKINDTKINSFDLNVRTRKAYFSTDNENIIYQLEVDTGLIKGALELPMADTVAVDWITDNVYVKSRSALHEIQACSFAAKMCGSILKVNAHETINTLAVDAYNSRLFVVVAHMQTFSAHKSRIDTANLDGRKRKSLLSLQISFITSLACDPYKKMLYYIDVYKKNLQAISYRSATKKTPTVILEKGNGIMQPSGLSWYENEVFITNLGDEEAMRCQLYGSKECKALNLNIRNAKDILIDGATRQPMKRNPCNVANCQGMCVQTEDSYECMCGSAIVSETKYCNASNEINATSLLMPLRATESNSPNSSYSNTKVWSLTIFLLLLIGTLGYIYYQRQRQTIRNFMPRLRFKNPIAFFKSRYENNTEILETQLLPSENDGSEAAAERMTTTFQVKEETVRMGSTLHRALHDPNLQRLHKNQLDQQPQLAESSLTQHFLVTDNDNNSTLLLNDNNEARAQLKP